jgi:PAS domain S-box-containing protein
MTTAGDPLAAALEEWLEANAAYGVFATDAGLQIRSWNQWLATATGLARSEVIGRPLFEVFPSLVARGMDQHYADALNGKVTVLSRSFHRYLLPSARGREQMPQSGRIAPLMQGDDVIGIVTTVEDVTERMAREGELRGQIATAERARRTAEAASRAKDEFLATLSHEIRTPLNAVLGWTRILLARQQPDADMVRRAVEVIDRNASAQLTLITDMLDVARIASGKVRLELNEIDLAKVVMAAIDVVRPAADVKGVRLITDLAPHVPAVAGDYDRLVQVAWNLLSNSVKFTESGGRVTIGLAAEEGVVRLTVADTGQGIDAGFLPHVFDRFRQADPSASRRHGGLGLGLALVRDLVELHGGTVTAESDGQGHGTLFTVALPAPTLAKNRTSPGLPPVPRVAAQLSGVNILLVEDDPDALDIALCTLADAGASVVSARSVPEALGILRDGTARPFDAVVTDIGMSDGDGYALLNEMRALPRQQVRDLPVIAVTAYAMPEDRKRALQAGFEAHLTKPFAAGTLISTISRATKR